MIFRELELAGAFVIEPETIEDERGFFVRTFDAREFAARGLDERVAQCSISFNRRAGTLRGMHFQSAPHAESKLVRCTRGALFDVIVDLRQGSPTLKGWTAVELTAENRLGLYIPQGLAHGFQTLEDETEVFYEISEPYKPSAAGGVRWDDPAFGIDWPEVKHRTMSDRDRAWPDFTG